jgi:hypothetical protein
MNAIKIEDLDMNEDQATIMLEAFRDILEEIEFSPERIDEIECRSRDGFIPYSHNKGGLQGYSYHLNHHLSGSGYDYGDGVIQKWYERQIELYRGDHPGKMRYLEQFWDNKRKDSSLMQKVLDHYYEYIDGDGDYDTTQISVRFMVQPDGSVDVDVFGSTSDAPYHRSSDYNKHENFTFKDTESFKKEVMKFLDTCDCIELIGEGW